MIRTPVAALDVGGTAIKSGLVLSGDRVVLTARTKVTAESARPHLLETFDSVLRPLVQRLDDGSTRTVRIAFPGPFDYPCGRPLLRHKFAALYGLDMGEALRTKLGAPGLRIEFVNDAEAAAVGEALVGAGSGAACVLMVTLGTGLGAALTVDGEPVRSVGGQDIGDLHRRDVTSATDGTAARPADDEFCAAGLAQRLGVRPHQLPDADRDSSSAGTLAEYGTDLGHFLAKVVADVAVDVDRIVVGGGAVPRSPDFDDALTAALSTPWSRARLGTSGPLIGAVRMRADRDGPA